MKRTIYTQEQIDQMKSLYLSGMAVKTIATTLSTDKGTCRRELKLAGILRTMGEAQRIAKGIKSVRSDAFDILIPEALYWIGFLYADGFIEGKVPVLGVALSEVDRDHVEKFNQFLGGYLKIAEIVQNKGRGLKGQVNEGGTLCRVKVADVRLYNRLKELGFTSNKTYDITPHELLRYSRDFWRGVVDGDGWITKGHSIYPSVNSGDIRYEYPKMGLCGNEATIQEFLNYIRLSGIECKSGVKRAKRENSLYSMDSVGKPAVQIMNLLYKDATVYLNRKYQKYQELISEPQSY